MDKYARNKYSLQFDSKEMEWVYKNYIVDHTIWFCRGAWMLIIVLGGSFGLLDRPLFGENADKVIMVRLFLISTSAVILALTFNPRVKRFLDRSSCLFILSIGFFCIFLTAMSDHSTFSPYFTGLFFAFTGIFSTAGLGFKYSFFALLINLIVFEVVIGLLVPVPLMLFIVYNFFLVSILFIFVYIGYLVENISRKNFVVTGKLQDSLSQVKQLSGMLPICASCKNIRDDKGYWKQIESYIRDHSEAEFSHGICPDCKDKLYPDLDI